MCPESSPLRRRGASSYVDRPYDRIQVVEMLQTQFGLTGARESCGQMTTQLLDAHPEPDDETIKHYLSGNLCRCAAYPEVLDAVRLASRKRKSLSAVRQHATANPGAS
jgi:aerobic-type carbon monoxide dehydrogenase small subunit (CoxS/CutS family)